MENKTKQIIQNASKEIEKAKSKQELFEINTHYLGKNGQISLLMQELKNCSKEDRPRLGSILNDCREKSRKRRSKIPDRN